MTKQEFLSALGKGLSGLPQNDAAERLSFYSEMIDDRMEEGLSEEEAVAQVGSVDEIVTQTLADTPLSKLVKEKVKPGRKLKAWEIVLLILGAPLWVPLLIAAAAVVFALYVTLWALIVSLWAVFASFVAGAVGGIAGGVAQLVIGNKPQGIALIGAGVCCAGLSIFAFFGCKAATVGAARLTKRFALWLKMRFVKKEEA
ncbi:MAG: DUF1700 domain-containing protein [Oscillospiraceae bacterium]|nr:DUF1700 domain-containing protein [Oscillospiraceae bacterium]